jgi:hypothetical protein
MHKTVILPLFPYGCDTWSVMLMEEHGLRVFEKRLLQTIFGPRRDEVIRGWKKLHEEPNNTYSS